MSQTLLSIAAVFAFALLGYSMHQHVAQTEQQAIVAELESAAFDLAQAWASRVKEYAFDEADVETEVLRPVGDTGGLTSSVNFGAETGEATFADFDDLDDFHALTERVAHPVSYGTHDFDVTFAVRYVTDLDFSVASAAATTAKEVTIVVREAAPVEGRPPVVITLATPLTPAKLFLHQ